MELWRRKKEKYKARTCFLKNGAMFLQQLIADCNGLSNPIRMFSLDQISKATHHFDPKCSLPCTSCCYTWYKGATEGRSYAIKRFTYPWHEDEPYNDIVLSARVSNHSGFLKLMGSCLELRRPMLVFEDIGYRVLNERGTVGGKNMQLLPWNFRLKIAKEVAIAITYLHTAFPRIIIHRDIKASNVILDKNGKAKLTDFSLALALAEGKSWLEDRVKGTMGYIDPGYLKTSLVTEYSDVFSFGILMSVLLMGRPPLLKGSDGWRDVSTNIVKYVKDLQEKGEPVEFGDDSNDMNPDQMKTFLELALRCCEERNGDRPKMILVAKKLKLIEQGSFACSEMPKNGSMSHQQPIAADSNNISTPILMLPSNKVSKATSHLDTECYLSAYVIITSFIFTILISYFLIKLFP